MSVSKCCSCHDATSQRNDMTLFLHEHYDDVKMGAMASQTTSLTIVYSIVYSGADQRKHQSSASLACVRGNHRGPVNSPHKWPVTRKMFPFDDVIMTNVTIIMSVTILDVTWLPWHLESPATPLLVQQLLHADNQENIQAPHCWPSVYLPVACWFSSHRASKAESVPMPWSHHN